MNYHLTKGVISLNSDRRDIWLSIDIHLCLRAKAHTGLQVPLTTFQSPYPSPLALPSPQLLTFLIPCYSLLFPHLLLLSHFCSILYLFLPCYLNHSFPLSLFLSLNHTQSDGHVFSCSGLFQMPLNAPSLHSSLPLSLPPFSPLSYLQSNLNHIIDLSRRQILYCASSHR